MPGRNVIFDLDGTLIDSSAGVVQATNYALAMLGLPTRDPAEIVTYIGYPLDVMFADFTDAPYPELARHFQVKARETVVESTTALPFAHETIVDLHRTGYRLAIATTKIRIHIDLILEKCGWRQYFAATVGGDEVTAVKPAPDAFTLAMQRLGADARDTIVVGDTVNDILGATAAGLPVIAVKSPFGQNGHLQQAAATYYLESLSALPTLLADHFAHGREHAR